MENIVFKWAIHHATINNIVNYFLSAEKKYPTSNRRNRRNLYSY